MFIYYNYLFAVIVISSNVCFSQNEGYFKHLKQNQEKKVRFAPTGHVMLHTKLDVRLMTTSQSEKEGIIEVKLENHTSYYVPICYDDSSDAALRYSYTVTHVTCRHLGFMTYQNQYSLPVSSGISYVGLKNSVYCEGHEQRLEQCYWNEFRLLPCEKVISVLCGSCVQQLHATEGLLTSPGFPHAYFYTLRCEWTITVLRDRDVALNFLDFIFPPSFTNHSCEGGDAHLDIAALDANSETYISQYTRYCSSKTPNKLQLSSGSVLINFFSGIYKQNINQNSQKSFGFRMFYQGVRKEGFSHYTLKVILTTLGIMVFLVMLAFCYFCNRHKNKKIKQEKRNASSTNRDTCHYPGVQIEQHQVITVNLQGPRNSTSSCDTCNIQHHYEEIPIQKQNEYTYLLQANMSPVEKLDSEDINNNVVIHTSDYETPILMKKKISSNSNHSKVCIQQRHKPLALDTDKQNYPTYMTLQISPPAPTVKSCEQICSTPVTKCSILSPDAKHTTENRCMKNIDTSTIFTCTVQNDVNRSPLSSVFRDKTYSSSSVFSSSDEPRTIMKCSRIKQECVKHQIISKKRSCSVPQLRQKKKSFWKIASSSHLSQLAKRKWNTCNTPESFIRSSEKQEMHSNEEKKNVFSVFDRSETLEHLPSSDISVNSLNKLATSPSLQQNTPIIKQISNIDLPKKRLTARKQCKHLSTLSLQKFVGDTTENELSKSAPVCKFPSSFVIPDIVVVDTSVEEKLNFSNPL